MYSILCPQDNGEPRVYFHLVAGGASSWPLSLERVDYTSYLHRLLTSLRNLGKVVK